MCIHLYGTHPHTYTTGDTYLSCGFVCTDEDLVVLKREREKERERERERERASKTGGWVNDQSVFMSYDVIKHHGVFATILVA